MAERITNDLIYEVLKSIQKNVADLKEAQRVTNERLGFLETGMAQLGMQVASVSTRIDHLDVRLDKIEKRLDLVKA